MTTMVRLLAGLGLLTLGRKLWWLFVAAIGFEFGFFLTGSILHRKPDNTSLLIAIVIGVLAALVAMSLQKMALRIIGFLAGGLLGVKLSMLYTLQAHDERLLLIVGAFLLGGLLGMILMAFLFEWALILLSSFVGAEMVSTVLSPHLPRALSMDILLLLLFCLGVLVQAWMKGGGKSRRA